MNLKSHRIRASAALLVALLAAAIFQLVLIKIALLDITGGTAFEQFLLTLQQTFAYGLPFGIAAVLATEYLALRKLNAHAAIGILSTFIGAHIATRNEPLTSYVFTGGALTPLGLLATGVAASVTYWAMAGRRAGWRGDAVEREYALATEAYGRVSAQAKAERCRPCLFIWAGASSVAFGLFAWLAIDVSGLRAGLQSTSEREGQSALAMSGYAWAAFKISDSRGSIQGTAPDDFEKRIAYETAREALNAVTGFPGVISRIEDRAVAQLPMAAVTQKIAEAQLREQQANQAIEDARLLAEAARTSQSVDHRQAGVQPGSGEAREMQNLASQQADVASGHASAQRHAAEAIAETFNEPQDDPVPHEQAVAAVSVEAPSAGQVGAGPPEPRSETDTCTDQDVALVESSQIIFEPQTFEIAMAFQRDLDRVAASVRSCAQRSILITGHADANADRLFNPALGLQRAGAVRDGLIARGVSATHIASRSPPNTLFGGTGSAEFRESFRRAEIKFIEGIEMSRDATQRPDERASNCESDLAEIMSQSIVHFPIASARVSEESLGLIAKLAGAIQNCGSVIVTVEGHTDKIGTPERNQQLSVLRANAVRDALVSVGADPTRLASRGFASTRPFASEETSEAYALNRRIEFKVSGKFTSTKAGGP